MTDEKHICPVCGKYEFQEYDSFEFCPICKWHDDALLTKKPEMRGYYHMNLNEAKKLFAAGKKVW